MKVNKKAVASTAAVLGVAALVAGGTIAYFTDAEKTDNNFTVGNVDIKLYESQLHRMNSGRTGSFDALSTDPDYCTYTGTNIDGNTGAGPQPKAGSTTLNYESAKYCTPGMDASEGDRDDIVAIANGHTGRTWGYKDATIINDAESYKAGADTAETTDDGYFTRVSKNIVPGQYIRKFSYVLNNDTYNKGSDAYVLIRYMVPEEYANIVDFELPSSAYLESKTDYTQKVKNGEGYFTLVEKNNSGTYDKVATMSTEDSSANKAALKAYRGHVENVDGQQYVVYSAVTTEALKPGEMTFWSPINTMKLDEGQVQTDAGNGLGEVNYANAAISVKVDAQAIQAKTFSDAIDAINNL